MTIATIPSTGRRTAIAPAGGPRPGADDLQRRAAHGGLVGRGLPAVFLISFGAMTSFYLLLSVVPLYAMSVGAGGLGGGLATGVLMASTVVTELATPRLMARFGRRRTLAAGLLLLGAPAAAMAASTTLGWILLVCAVRGLGFAIVVVVTGALVAELVPAERRGEGLGLFGIVVGVPAIVMLPLGVWLAGRLGYGPIFAATAVAAFAGLALVAGLPGDRLRRDEGAAAPQDRVLACLREPALVRPSISFAATAVAAGIVVAFLPVAVTGNGGDLAVAALLVQAVAATVTRWLAGRHGDRHGCARQLVPALLVSAAGMLAMVAAASPAAVLLGMLLFGSGFGVAQNASLALMFSRVPSSRFGTVSAVWNLAYDAGMGLGAVGFGVLAAAGTGYPGAFALTALLMLAALPCAWRDRRVAPAVQAWPRPSP